MLDQATIEKIAEQVIREMGLSGDGASFGGTKTLQTLGGDPKIPQLGGRESGQSPTGALEPTLPSIARHGGAILDSLGGATPLKDMTSPEEKAIPTLREPEDYDALIRMKGKTGARIGVGKCGPRLPTKTLLTLRADHALARDAVFTDVDRGFLEACGLFSVQTKCADKNDHITRPDLGRQLSDEAVNAIRQKCRSGADVQIIVSDGLSSKAVEANVQNALPAIREGLGGLTVGEPFFIRFGRVAVEDQVAELLNAKVVCVLIGERPGLGTAESMSAYLCYNAKVGQPEARRTVVSNIHSGGISAVEAGAYISELIRKILNAKASGVELKQ